MCVRNEDRSPVAVHMNRPQGSDLIFNPTFRLVLKFDSGEEPAIFFTRGGGVGG